MGRKPRSDAKLHQLPMEQQQELCEWLLGGMSYQVARAGVLKEFKVQVSTGALHDFYHSFCVPELVRRRATEKETADEIVAEARENPGQWTEAALDKLGQYAANLMLRGASPKDVKAIFALLFKKEDGDFKREQLELEKRKVALKEEAAAEAKAKLTAITAKAKASGGITPETLVEIEQVAGLL